MKDLFTSNLTLLRELNWLYKCHSLDELLKTTSHLFLHATTCTSVSWYELEKNMHLRWYDHQIKKKIQSDPTFKEKLQTLISYHPFTHHFLSNEETDILNLSTLLDTTEHSSRILKFMQSTWQTRYLLGAWIHLSNGRFIAFSVRNQTEFSREETELVKNIMEHVRRRANHLGITHHATTPVPDGHLVTRCKDRLTTHYKLTPREAETAHWISKGKSNNDVGNIMGISPHTIRTHLQRTFKKMGLSSRTELAQTIWEILIQSSAENPY